MITHKLGNTGPIGLARSGSAAWACRISTARLIAPRASPPFTPRSRPASRCSTPGDFYGMGHNELLIKEALKGRNRDNLQISVKFGALRDAAHGLPRHRYAPGRDQELSSPIRCSGSASRHIDIYRPARLDPNVPIEETIGGIADMVKAGYVRRIDLSRSAPTPSAAPHKVHPIVDLQIEYSLISRGIEDEILAVCRELGIGITAYGVLSRSSSAAIGPRTRPAAFAPRARASRPAMSKTIWRWSSGWRGRGRSRHFRRADGDCPGSRRRAPTSCR